MARHWLAWSGGKEAYLSERMRILEAQASTEEDEDENEEAMCCPLWDAQAASVIRRWEISSGLNCSSIKSCVPEWNKGVYSKTSVAVFLGPYENVAIGRIT